MNTKEAEFKYHAALNMAKHDEDLLLNTLIIHALGSILNIAQMVAVRERSMSTHSLKNDATKLEQIATKLMNMNLSRIKLGVNAELKEFMEYEHASELYRIIANLAPKNIGYVKDIADELDQKDKMYKQLLKEAFDAKQKPLPPFQP